MLLVFSILFFTLYYDSTYSISFFALYSNCDRAVIYTTKVVQAGSPCVFITWNWMSLILNALITTLAVVTIFIHHKKSKTVKPTLFLQLRLCIVNIVLQLGLIVLMWLQVRQRSNELNAEWFADISFIFPLIGVIFTWLAIRGIVKDITLLKSFDRIR